MSVQAPANPGDNPKKFKPYVPENMEMREFTLARGAAGTRDDGGSGRSQCLSRPARRDHDCGHLSGGSDRHGGDAGMEGIAARREHRPNCRFDRRRHRGRRNLHHSRVSDCQGVAFVPPGRCVLEVHRADHGGQHPRSAVHFAGAPRDGGRSGIALPRIGGSVGNSQGGTARRGSREISFLEYRRGRRGVHARTLWIVCRRQRFSLSPSAIWAAARFVWAPPGTPTYWPPAAPAHSPRRASVRPIWVWATSSDSDLASIQFAGGVLAWGLLVPLLIFFLGPQLKQYLPADTPDNWAAMAVAVWRFIVRPIAVGGMLVGAAYTLYGMRKSLTAGLGKAFSDLRQTAEQQAKLVAHRALHELRRRSSV